VDRRETARGEEKNKGLTFSSPYRLEKTGERKEREVKPARLPVRDATLLSVGLNPGGVGLGKKVCLTKPKIREYGAKKKGVEGRVELHSHGWFKKGQNSGEALE